jgi:hypothetical protein
MVMLIKLKLGGCPMANGSSPCQLKWRESVSCPKSYGLLSYVLASKLKALKADLKKWNEELFGDVGKKKKKKNELLAGIRELDIIAECRCLVEEERVKKRDTSKELEKTLIF